MRAGRLPPKIKVLFKVLAHQMQEPTDPHVGPQGHPTPENHKDQPVSADFDTRLARFDRELQAAEDAGKQAQMAGIKGPDGAALRASRIGLELMVAILAGVGIGYLIDRTLNTKPLFILLLSLIGFGAGMMNAWRALNGRYGQVGLGNNQQDDR